MKLYRFGILLFLISPGIATAQTSVQLNSSEIKQGINKLDVLGSALYIAAHPDDENTRLLTYLAKEKKIRTGYLSLTRGDGGQNLIGNEQSELLGLIRTQELLAARRMDGAEQFFSRAIDFGFSKSTEESLKIWDHEQVLADAVWVIRKFRPDIIITRFPEDARAGHGQHSASAVIAHEAFLAAGDPTRFPGQLKQLTVWQPKRIIWNTSNFGGNNLTSTEQIKIDIGGFNPLLGKSYGEIAADSRTNHKSQGFGSARQRGQSLEYFSHTDGEAAKTNIFDGINTTWQRIEGGGEISRLIKETAAKFDIENPSASVKDLLGILSELERLKDQYWKAQKIREIKDLIAAASGLWFESYAPESTYSIGETIPVRSHIVQQSPGTIMLKKIGSEIINEELQPGVTKNFESKELAVKITQPYWLQDESSHGIYSIPEITLTGLPENPTEINRTFTFNIYGKEIRFTSPVVFKSTDPVRGEIYEPLVIAPPVTATLTEKAYLFGGIKTKSVIVRLQSFKDNAAGTLKPEIPQGWKVEPAVISFNLIKKGDEKAVEFKLSASPGATKGKIKLNINVAGKMLNNGYTVIDYDHIPKQSLFPRSEARIENIDLKTGGKLIGYIPGAGDLIPQSLEQVGYQVNILSEAQILNADLSKYDAIITGVRAYNVNERMEVIQPRLLDYVAKGGVYLVQYNTNAGLQMSQAGPYPFRISRDRVTDEAAEVRFIDPASEVLNYPNKITSADFAGWVQERGLYFTAEADPKYQRIFSINDPDERPQDGALLVTDYGKGRFVYTSLAFFRELPAGVPGAYRLFVNLLSKNKLK